MHGNNVKWMTVQLGGHLLKYGMLLDSTNSSHDIAPMLLKDQATDMFLTAPLKAIFRHRNATASFARLANVQTRPRECLSDGTINQKYLVLPLI